MKYPYPNFYPESLTLVIEFCRSPGLRLVVYLPILKKQWYKKNLQQASRIFGTKLTVAGTAPDFNRIPF